MSSVTSPPAEGHKASCSFSFPITDLYTPFHQLAALPICLEHFFKEENEYGLISQGALPWFSFSPVTTVPNVVVIVPVQVLSLYTSVSMKRVMTWSHSAFCLTVWTSDVVLYCVCPLQLADVIGCAL